MKFRSINGRTIGSKSAGSLGLLGGLREMSEGERARWQPSTTGKSFTGSPASISSRLSRKALYEIQQRTQRSLPAPFVHSPLHPSYRSSPNAASNDSRARVRPCVFHFMRSSVWRKEYGKACRVEGRADVGLIRTSEIRTPSDGADTLARGYRYAFGCQYARNS